MATAIPTISSDLKSAAGYTWIGGAYLLANAASSPIWAKLSDIWGRKPILLLVVVTFAISSVICATSVNMNMLITGRVLQGCSGGGLIQLVHITISDIFSMRWVNRPFLGTTNILQKQKLISRTFGDDVGIGRWSWPYSRRRFHRACIMAMELLDQPSNISNDICPALRLFGRSQSADQSHARAAGC